MSRKVPRRYNKAGTTLVEKGAILAQKEDAWLEQRRQIGRTKTIW
jgi:hypothetical protein